MTLKHYGLFLCMVTQNYAFISWLLNCLHRTGILFPAIKYTSPLKTANEVPIRKCKVRQLGEKDSKFIYTLTGSNLGVTDQWIEGSLKMSA